MRRITLERNDYRGRTAAVPWQRPHDPLDCKRCGSSPYGRREGVRRMTTRGAAVVVDVFRCRCGKGRHIKREAVA
jgi:hypothetical protein